MVHETQVMFPTLGAALEQINRKRAENGSAQINNADWSAFLSGINGAAVRKLWLVDLLKAKPIPSKKALAVLSGVNAALKQVGLAPLKAECLLATKSL